MLGLTGRKLQQSGHPFSGPLVIFCPVALSVTQRLGDKHIIRTQQEQSIPYIHQVWLQLPILYTSEMLFRWRELKDRVNDLTLTMKPWVSST